MNMKRPLAFLLAAGMTLGLTACGDPSQPGSSNAPASSSPSANSPDSSAVTLDLWSFNIGSFTEASNWDSILTAFNDKYPDITVNVTPINYQDGDQKLTSAITSGSGPDIIFEGPERIVGNYAREGLMVDLSDLWEAGGADIAEGMTIQYGGSMNPANAAELLSKPDVDGGLIGGASLHAGKFCEIVDAATKG